MVGVGSKASGLPSFAVFAYEAVFTVPSSGDVGGAVVALAAVWDRLERYFDGRISWFR